MTDHSEMRFRDRLVKHMTTDPTPVERPADFGRQSHRLLGEITEGIREEDASSSARVKLPLRGQFEQLKGGDLGAALIGDMSSRVPTVVAGDQDVFGAPMLERASRQMRLASSLSGPKRELAEAVAARNDVARSEAAAELERRTQELEAARVMAEYPDIDPETALLMAGGGEDDDGPVAA